ncbi:MAG: T9SS type A sorting domain-containing protein [Ignavibacteria bacterium]|nr:T9SS type A sorting domain-containing protein [Ignavibacteria bacterium]
MKAIYIILLVFFITNTSIAQDKKVLFEEFTNASCDPCAQNNPALKAFTDSKGDTIVSVMYHIEFPGFDPMYNLNPSQVDQRKAGYYSDVNAVPWLKGDGNLFPDIWPFSQANLDDAFNTRKAVVPRVLISVTDERIAGDSMKATVYVNIPQNLVTGEYKLRVMAVEKVVEYATPPGTNGERIFDHAFRKGVPDMAGTFISLVAGNYIYIFKYKFEPEWINANINTIAFVQTDGGSKEVLNCALSTSGSTGITNTQTGIPESFALEQNFPNPFNPNTNIRFSIPKFSNVNITVFNSLGREVSVLLNENVNPGNYDINFDASMLSSGVYFYKIDAGDFSDIKKMTLIK